MNLFKSLQFKIMVGLALVGCLAAVVVDYVYRSWLEESHRSTITAHVEHVLADLNVTITLTPNPDSFLMPIYREGELNGVGLLTRDGAQPATIFRFLGVHASVQDMRAMLRESPISPPDLENGFLRWWEQSSDAWTLYGFRAVRDADGKEYWLVAVYTTDNQLLSVKNLDQISWTVLMVALLLAILFSSLLRRVITRSLSRFSAGLAQVAAGDFSHELSTNVDRELLDLVAAYNIMLRRLQENKREIEAHQATLEDKVEAATAELMKKEKALHQAEQLATIGQLSAGVVHEINNPLQHIVLTCGLVRTDDLEPDAKKRIAQIIQQTKRCQRIVQGLLDYARSGTAVLHAFPLQQQIEDCLRQFREQELLAGITVLVEIPEDLFNVYGSSDEIRRVLDNVILNAVQVMQERGTLTITAALFSATEIEVSIRDDGPGMDEATKQRVFEPFFTTKPVGHGTGLGLAIAHGIITRQGGSIRIDSQLERGTTVRLRLPAVPKKEKRASRRK